LIFAKIDYINLLPFYLFIKREIKNTQFKQSINYHKDFPSNINKRFKQRKIDAAFISSIESKRGNFYRLDIGIVANGKIKSVLVKRDSRFKEDSHSATSNILAKKLNIDGEVIIGDKALRRYCKDPKSYIDLANEWEKRYKLPFVFARLCVNKNYKFYKRLSSRFLSKSIKIPHYIIKRYSKTRDIPISEIKSYLKLVSYKLSTKELNSLKRFLR